MRALVTGGAGFIGSHLIDRLVARGDEVVIIDNLSSGHASFIQGHLDSGKAVMVEGDICVPEDVSKAMAMDIDCVFISLQTRTFVLALASPIPISNKARSRPTTFLRPCALTV